MVNHNNSDRKTNRRNLLKTVSVSALATPLFAGAASADDGSDIGTQNCDHMETEYRCVETSCDCCSCGCCCETEQQTRDCCVDRYGNTISCSSWSSTGDCCVTC
jgi:anaerobic selenocysteine-containing dehydrogenase